MNDAEWLDCESVTEMLHFLRYDASADPGRARKYRLFACGCVRRIDGLDDDSLEAVALAERLADKNLSDRKVDAIELRIARNSGLQHSVPEGFESMRIKHKGLQTLADPGSK